jgi:hypothetical protein
MEERIDEQGRGNSPTKKSLRFPPRVLEGVSLLQTATGNLSAHLLYSASDALEDHLGVRCYLTGILWGRMERQFEHLFLNCAETFVRCAGQVAV